MYPLLSVNCMQVSYIIFILTGQLFMTMIYYTLNKLSEQLRCMAEDIW